jgi:Fe-S cluster assembly ATP-binding protein
MGKLELKNLTLKLGGKNIVENVSIDFREGQIHAIVGPNGAGKSTLAHIIMGLPDYRDIEGEILFDGIPISGLTIDKRAKLGITLAWQEPARFQGISVRSFMLAAAKDKTEEAVELALKMVGLDPDLYKDRAVDETLSGGERKRIELASIIAMRPKLVLMDEPDSGVDIEAINNIFSVIHKLKAEGTTVILITHSPEVLKEADHAFLLCRGQLVKKGPVEEMVCIFNGTYKTCERLVQPQAEAIA